jgi:hypothetical protein
MGTRLQTAPVCQFQHWAQKINALDAVAGSPVKSSPATAWFIRPSSAALLPSFSWWASSQISSRNKRDHFHGNLPRPSDTSIGQAIPFGPVLPDNDYVTVAAHILKQAVYAQDGETAGGRDAVHYLRAGDRVVLAQDFLPIENQQYCIGSSTGPCRKRYDAIFYFHYFVQGRVNTWRFRLGRGSWRLKVHLGRFSLWLWTWLRWGSRYHISPREKISPHSFGWPFGLKGILPISGFESVGVFHWFAFRGVKLNIEA